MNLQRINGFLATSAFVLLLCLDAAPAAMAGEAESPRPAPTVRWAGGADHVTVQLLRAGDFFLVPLRINGHDAGLFLIDTCFATTSVDREVAHLLGLPVIGTSAGRVGAQPVGDFVEARETAIGAGTGVGVTSRMILLSADLRAALAEAGIKAAGVIGNDFLKAQPVSLDTRAATLTFYDSARFASAFPPAADPATRPTTSPAGQAAPTTAAAGPTTRAVVSTGRLHVHRAGAFPLLEGSVGGHEGWFVLETASPGLLTLYGPFLTMNRDLEETYHSIPGGAMLAGGDPLTRAMDAADFEAVAILGRPPARLFGSFSLPGLPAATSFEITCAGSIGARSLRDCRLTLDYHGERFWTETLPPESISQMMLRLGEMPAHDLLGVTPLERAAQAGRPEVVQALLRQGADPNAPDAGDVTPLMAAANGRSPAIVSMLLAAGAKPDAAAALGASTALLDAAARGDCAVVRVLLDAKASPSQANLRGDTPLHMAVAAGSLPCVQVLLADHADVSAKNKEGVTVLMSAAISGEPAILAALLKAGADPNQAGRGGWTALIVTAAAGARIDSLTALLDAGAKIDARDDAGRTALMYTAQLGDARASHFLMSRGADPNAKSYDGRSVVTYAIAAPQTDVLTLLPTPPQTPNQ